MKARDTAMDSWRNGTGGASAGSPAAGGAGRVYSAGIYARLSVEGSEEKNGSIENQIAIAKAYLERQPDMVLYGCYTDLGKTGTNFRREGFQGLMADVRMRRVDCVIVKDDCVIKARTPQTLENRHFLRIGTEFRAIQRPQRAAYHIETS